MSNEVLEDRKKVKKRVPGLVSVTAILNYLVLGIILIGVLVNFILMLNQYLSITGSVGRGFTGAVISFLVIIGILVMSIYGAAIMHKGRKKGFVFYTIGIGLIVFFILWLTVVPAYGAVSSELISNFVIAGIAFLFIIIFATQLKHLN